MITKKNINKLQNAVIKENAANLVGAVKLYNALFANGAGNTGRIRRKGCSPRQG